MNKPYKVTVILKGIGIIGEKPVSSKSGQLLQQEVTKIYRKYLRDTLNITKPRFINSNIPDKDDEPQAFRDYKDGWYRIATIYSDLDIRGREHLIRWEVTRLKPMAEQDPLKSKLENTISELIDQKVQLSPENKQIALQGIVSRVYHLIETINIIEIKEN